MGLRAFTSQLLCEQVIGRGLRRVPTTRTENGLFLRNTSMCLACRCPSFRTRARPEKHRRRQSRACRLKALPERNALEIRWPQVLRIETVVNPALVIDWRR